MKNLFKSLFILLMVVAFASCSKVYYQVYKVESKGLIHKDNSMVYENDDCRILYNFWSPNGSMAFLFENKTDYEIYIHMSKSFFIKNGHASDYYKNRTFEKGSKLSLSYDEEYTYLTEKFFGLERYQLPITTTLKDGVKAASYSSVSLQEAETICIPPHSYKYLNDYTIQTTILKTCDNKKDYPQSQETINVFNEADSPLKLRNRLAYSFDKECKDLRYIDNGFWLSEIVNFSSKSATEKVKKTIDCIKKEGTRFKIGSPGQFYIKYSFNPAFDD